MLELVDKFEGPLLIDTDTNLRGLVIGRVIVDGPATCELRGTVEGDLVVEPGATVNVHGTVAGAVINHGGRVTIFGTVGSVTGSHPSHIEPEAIVRA